MIRHIVMWTLKDSAEGAGKASNARRMKELLEALPARIPFVRELAVGIDVFAATPPCDVVLSTSFDTRADLDAYQVNPDHLAVVAFIKKVVANRNVLDYEL